MDTLNTLITNFSIESLIQFFRQKINTFKPEKENYEYLFEDNESIIENYEDIKKIGEADINNSDDLIIITAKTIAQLTNRTGKKRQFEIAKKILKEEYKDAAFFIFYDENGNFRFSFIRANYIGVKRDYSTWKRYTYFVNPEKPNKTFRKQIDKCDFDSLDNILKAFSLEAVTDDFYNEFSPRFEEIATSIDGEIDIYVKQDFALLFVIRTIFIGFLQKRKWIGDDEEFLLSFWNEYKEKFYGEDKFYSEWLEPLFFEALNSQPGTEVKYGNNKFSKKTRIALKMAPYLNGELFKPKAGYDNKVLFVPDKIVEAFFDFLFQYNFTIEENTRYDEDLELNPEFLGIIFERLVNKKNGAVYTPRTEVDFMCRISLVKWLQKVSSVNTRDLYYLFFRELGNGEEFEDYQKEGDFSKHELEELIPLLKAVTVCDPASGSGAFPVGMMQVLNETIQNLQARDKTPDHLKDEDDFERKKSIIANSLYGVEVKRWAVWINQLRLWLSLFVDIPAEREDEFRTSFTPLLPNLGFKIRRGDSIVQRIGNKLFPVEGHQQLLTSSLKKQIIELKKDKIEFFYNRSGKFNEIKKKEDSIFRTIINEQISEKVKELRILSREPESEQTSMFPSAKPKQTNLELYKKQIEQLKNEIEILREEKAAFKEDHPLIWNIEFAEIFYDKGGFDIIIGNPPYIRQEDISDPEGKIEKATDYKKLLQETIRQEFPNHFKAKEKIDGKSDLYTFFYLKSLRLLNINGIHTFICENTWLDVEYGIWMQKFLLRNCHVHYIIENHAKRSFASVDVNTIISVIDAPVKYKKDINQQFNYKLIAFKKPFEEVLFTENLLDIEEQKNEIVKNNSYRSFPISIEKLIEEGSNFENEQQKELKLGKYEGDKWGSKYLKAPDLFFDILFKGKCHLIKLKEVGEVKYGIKTGYNNFFYLNNKDILKWEIEKEYLKPIIKSPTECNFYLLSHTNFKFNVFLCNKSKADLKGTNALKYIEYGEGLEIEIKQGSNKGQKVIGVHNLKSVQSRKLWYSIGEVEGNTFWNKELRQRLFCSYSDRKALADCRLYYGNFDNNIKCYINSTLYHFFEEVLNREIGGGGGPRSVMVYEVNNSLILNPKILNFNNIFLNREVKTIFIECGIKPESDIPISEQEPNPLPDRKELDDVVFDALDLTQEERKEVYRAVCQLVWNRISKAKSVK